VTESEKFILWQYAEKKAKRYSKKDVIKSENYAFGAYLRAVDCDSLEIAKKTVKRALRAAYQRDYRKRKKEGGDPLPVFQWDGNELDEPLFRPTITALDPYIDHMLFLTIQEDLKGTVEKQVFLLRKHGYENKEIAELCEITERHVRRVLGSKKYEPIKNILRESEQIGHSKECIDWQFEHLEVPMEERVQFLDDLSKPVQRMINGLSKGLKIQPWTVVENMLLAYLAERAAEEIVWGKTDDLIPEFTETDQGYMTGEALFDFLLNYYSEGLRLEKRTAFENDLRYWPKDQVKELYQQYGYEAEYVKHLEDSSPHQQTHVISLCISARNTVRQNRQPSRFQTTGH
jgi:hypothetical protein